MNEGMRDGIIFDLDGTLLDSMWVWDDVDREFLGNRGLEVPADYQKEIVALGFEETAHYTIERFHLDEDPADIMNEWRHMAEEKYAWDVDVKPMVIPMLAWFKDHDMKLGIATSSYESLFMPCLERNQILQYFDAIAKTEEVHVGKNKPDVYLLAAEKLKKRPEECVVFEDIFQGIQTAKEAGFHTVAVYDEKNRDMWEKTKEIAHHSILNFNELFETKNRMKEVFFG